MSWNFELDNFNLEMENYTNHTRKLTMYRRKLRLINFTVGRKLTEYNNGQNGLVIGMSTDLMLSGGSEGKTLTITMGRVTLKISRSPHTD